MTWMIRCIAACWLLLSCQPVWAADQCRLCHAPDITVKGAHHSLACRDCHQSVSAVLADPAERGHGSAGCVGCHQGYQRMYQHAMASRAKEQAFINRSYDKRDREFAQKNCSSCHLRGCTDCHGTGHTISRPKADTCSRCHKGYYVGWDYVGRAPREEHERYQRGERLQDETFLKMLPDVHHQRGLTCSACHTMQSLINGQVAAKSCTDCHRPSLRVLEHQIAAHLENMECVACHAAWAPQEYGTFYLRFASGSVEDPFQALTYTQNGYARSVYLKRQDLPPLGINSRGKVAPIRPQYIAYYSQFSKGRSIGRENELLAAEWRAFSPHTIQRGTALCDQCHDNPRRFLLERPQDRIYDLQKDGMGLHSFWSQTGQRMVNGRFMDAARYRQMSTKSTTYKRIYVQKWKKFSTPAAPSLPR